MDPVSELQRLAELLRSVQGVEGTVIARRDGLVISHDLPEHVSAKRIAAMAAAIVNASTNAIFELERGQFQMTIVQSSIGKVVCLGAGIEAILATLVSNEANLGLILIQIDRIGKRVEEVIEFL